MDSSFTIWCICGLSVSPGPLACRFRFPSGTSVLYCLQLSCRGVGLGKVILPSTMETNEGYLLLDTRASMKLPSRFSARHDCHRSAKSASAEVAFLHTRGQLKVQAQRSRRRISHGEPHPRSLPSTHLQHPVLAGGARPPQRGDQGGGFRGDFLI